jgi:diacylglycerol kinase (ATP)
MACVTSCLQVHDECRDKYVGGHEDCDLGELRRLILPSTSFRVSQLGMPYALPCHVPASVTPGCLALLGLTSPARCLDPDGEAAYADIARPIHIAPPPGSLPLVVFLNSGSGGQQGVGLHRKFSYMLNPRQVFDLQSQPPAIALNQYKDVPGLVVLCCGGDGTVGWLLSELDNIDFGGRPVPPVAILPLGTGNDLARCFGWGGGYTGEHLVPILRSIETAPVDLLDRWAITIEPLTGAGAGAEAGDEAPLSIINNYFSIGVDAAVAHKVRSRRMLLYAKAGR